MNYGDLRNPYYINGVERVFHWDLSNDAFDEVISWNGANEKFFYLLAFLWHGVDTNDKELRMQWDGHTGNKWCHRQDPDTNPVVKGAHYGNAPQTSILIGNYTPDGSMIRGLFQTSDQSSSAYISGVIDCSFFNSTHNARMTINSGADLAQTPSSQVRLYAATNVYGFISVYRKVLI